MAHKSFDVIFKVRKTPDVGAWSVRTPTPGGFWGMTINVAPSTAFGLISRLGASWSVEFSVKVTDRGKGDCKGMKPMPGQTWASQVKIEER